jgi:hypothetical protein
MNDVSVSPADVLVNDSASATKVSLGPRPSWNDLSEAVATAQETAREIGDHETADSLAAVIRAIGDAKDELDGVEFDVDSIVSRVDEAEDDNAVSVGDVDASTPDRVIRTFVMSVGAERVLRMLDRLTTPTKATLAND